MPALVSDFVLRARQLDIEAIQALAQRVDLAAVIGQLVHLLQRERGLSSIYLASQGQRLATDRQVAIEETRPAEAALASLFQAQLQPASGASARSLSLMAWVMLDLETLQALRAAIDQRAPTAHDAVAGYSRVIAGLVELIFHLADAAPDPVISRMLVALVHLVQGKEAAGQERALGAQLFASGQCDDDSQQRVVHLIDAQERALHVFAEFAEADLRARWEHHQLTPHVAQLERLRRTLCTARTGTALDSALSETWFDAGSARIGELWALEATLVGRLREACEARVQSAQRELQDSAGLLRQLRDNPPPRANEVDRFFGAGVTEPATPQPASAASLESEAVASLKALLQQQGGRLARMEAELDTARRALQERKIIERAKGALMARLGLSEEAAFRMMQKASMDHNKKLLDVAEAMLALPEAAFGGRAMR